MAKIGSKFGIDVYSVCHARKYGIKVDLNLMNERRYMGNERMKKSLGAKSDLNNEK